MYQTAPQPGYMYQPPTMGQMGQVPAINSFPIANQPVNTTQSGIPLQQLRNDLATKIANMANSDVLAATLYQSCIGPNQNWATGKLDKLVNILQITLDFMWRQNPQGNIQTVYNQAMDEVYGCAWAETSRMYPNLLYDPIVQQRQTLINQWLSVAQQRVQQFGQAGLIQNNPIQNVQPWNTPSFQYGMPQNPGVQMQTQHFNHGQQPGYNGYQNGYNTYHQQPQQRMGMAGFTTQPATNAYQQTQSAWGESVNQDDAIERAKREHAEMMKTWTGPVDKWGYPITDGSVSSSSPVSTQTQSTMPYADNLNGINQIPNKPSIAEQLKQPGQSRMDTTGCDVIQYGQETLTPTQPTSSTLQDAFVNAGVAPELVAQANQMVKSSNGLVEIDMTNQDTLKQVFADVLRQEDADNPSGTKGLLPDEERCLTDKERRQLYAQGVEFELPFRAPVTAHPLHNALHAVLLKNGKVRQIITPLEEGVDMRLPTHQDILAPLREDKSVQRDPNKDKFVSGRLETISTMGGVIYDRFALSKQVLFDGVKTAITAENEEERNILLRKAFGLFDKQIEKDLFNEASGKTRYLALNPPEEGEEDFIHPIFDDEEEMAKRVANDALTERIEVQKEIYTVDSVAGTDTACLIDDIVNNTPVTQDRGKLGTYHQTRILHVFNNLDEAELVREELKDFFWTEEAEEKDVHEKLDAAYYAEVLNTRREYIPVYLWEKLNNRLTEYTNDAIRYVLGIERLRIDSFAEDYEALLDTLYRDDKCKQYYLMNPKYDNLGVAIGAMNTLIALQARCLHDAKEYDMVTDTGEKIDLVNKRAICSVDHIQVLNVATLARTCGINTNITLINSDSEFGIWKHCVQMCADSFSSRVNRLGFKHPITGMYVKFADGNTYRVFPRLGDLTNYHTRVKEDGNAEFFDVITLVKVPYYI